MLFIQKKGFNIKNGRLEKQYNIQMKKTNKGYNIVGYDNDKIIIVNKTETRHPDRLSRCAIYARKPIHTRAIYI